MKTRQTRDRLQYTIIGQYCHNSSTEFIIIWQASLKAEWRTLIGRFKPRISQAVTTLSFIFSSPPRKFKPRNTSYILI